VKLSDPYDPDNVFARIIRGELPRVEVFEDARTLAIMDAFPQADGHVLVLPTKAQAANLLALGEEDAAAVARTVRRVAAAVVAALDPDGVRVLQFNGAAAGQTVFHYHVHVLPTWAGRARRPHGQGAADPAALEAIARRIRAEL
jgi:histidine triad (HIT) family protein